MARIPVKSWREFEGEHVFVAYNLHACRVGKEPRPGEACFTVRYKPGGKVQAHIREITLEDAAPKILPGTLRAIREHGSRQVCCYIEGTVVPPKEAHGRKRRASFNPFKADSFYLTSSGEELLHADYAVFEDRSMFAIRPNAARAAANPTFHLPPELDPVPMMDVRRLKAKLLR